jgi:syntaxin 5
LTFIIKQDIAGINKQIAALQSYVKDRQGSSSSSEGKMVDEHNSNVVMMLQSNLATTSMTFKDVLELRTQVSIIFSNVIERANNLMKEYEGI